jgi:aminoglycoside phosphotransferase (APT) family kinase protein
MLRSLAKAVGVLGLTDAVPVGGGLEFRVWRARHPEWGEVALRAPQHRFETNDNDPFVDTGALLRREALLYRHLGKTGFPVPRHFEILSGEVDVAVSEFIETDGTQFRSFELGAAVARLHEPDLAIGLAEGHLACSFPGTITERLTRRWAALRAVEPRLPALPATAELEPLIPGRAADSLLHLDLRAANLLVRDGSIRAVIDWSNSMVGDPALELARAAEYARLPENGLDYSDFVHGYASVRPVPDRPAATWDLYRLDAAVMLAVVFTSEAPDPVRGRAMLDRLLDWSRDLPYTRTSR